ncbi:MAG: aspartate kinase [Candidatus Bathyarchaeia archaeon]
MVRLGEDKGCIVVKFGGGSLSGGERFAKAIDAVVKKAKEGVGLVVVVSAMGRTTDELIEVATKASGGRPSPRELDDLLSMGERTSARIFATALKAKGMRTCYLDPTDEEWPIITDENFGNARPLLSLCLERIQRTMIPLLEDGIIPVVPGFLGRSQKGAITTLGRGGSDTTAFIVARALKAKQIILVTNVKGIMTADPKIIKNPRKIERIDAETLAGLADSDVKFIHKKALKYKDPSVDIKVVDWEAGSLDAEGTIIRGSLPKDLRVEADYEEPLMAITIVGRGLEDSPEVLRRVLDELKRAGVASLGMSSNSNSIILYLPEKVPEGLLEALHNVVLEYPDKAIALAVKRGLSLLRIRGMGLEDTPGVIGRLTKPLQENNINISGMLTITSSILVFLDWGERERALGLIRDSLRPNDGEVLGEGEI